MNDIRIALDSRAKSVLIGISDSYNKIELSASQSFGSKNSSTLVPWIKEKLEENKINLPDVKMWTIGTGPGSFTVLRTLASLVSGIVFRRPEIVGRGIPSACAIASFFAKKTNAILIHVLFATPEKNIFFHSIETEKEIRPLKYGFIREKSDFAKFAKDSIFASLREDFMIFEQLLDESIRVQTIEEYPILELNRIMPDFIDKNSLRDLIYIRPPTSVQANTNNL